MRITSIIFIIVIVQITFLLNCVDAFDNPNCQFTLIVTTINERIDTIRVEIEYHSIDTLESKADAVFIGHHEYQGREVCLSPSELVLTHNTYIRSASLQYDSLIQTDTINPWEFSYEIGETNIIEEVEVLIR